MQERSILKDTIKLTAVQFSLDLISLVANLWLTRTAGSAAVGMTALVGAFFNLASMAAGGSGYLCASRFISEEIGRKKGNPEGVLGYVIMMSLMLGIPGSCIITGFSPFIAEKFFHSSEMTSTVCILAAVLPFGGIAASMKGWCNAVCRVKIAAFCDAAEFVVRISVLALCIIETGVNDTKSLCNALALSMAAGTAVSLTVLTIDFLTHRLRSVHNTTIRFSSYVRLAIPVIFSGCLTSALSTANDALIPGTLRQSGSTAEAALAQFGIFEAIVIPVLFFPTAVLCVLSGILIPEAARANAGEKKERLRYLTKRSIKFTMYFSLFVSAALLMFGKNIALILNEEPLAGKMLRLLAPIVPFIYLEIILEAVIKGTGKQQFSMLNYLAEYAVRISVVLIFIPIMGFYGIVLSYYASNVFGNCMRFIKVCKITEFLPDWKEMLIYPLISAAAAFYIPYTAFRWFGISSDDSLLWTAAEFLISAVLYTLITSAMKSSHYNIRKRKFNCTTESVK